MASLAFCVALAMMTSAISSIAEATDAGDWYVDLGGSETPPARLGRARELRPEHVLLPAFLGLLGVCGKMRRAMAPGPSATSA